MKALIITALTMFASMVVAQEISNANIKMSLGDQPGYSITVEGADKKIMESTWKGIMKEYAKKTKYNKKAKEYYSNKAVISSINGTDMVDVYLHIDQQKGQSTATMWVDLQGEFANHETSPKQAMAAESFLTQYFVAARKAAIEKELKTEKKKLKSIEKQLTKLEKRNKRLHDDIEAYKEKISRAENDIAENLEEQDAKSVEIKKQKSWIEKVIEKLNGVGKE